VLILLLVLVITDFELLLVLPAELVIVPLVIVLVTELVPELLVESPIALVLPMRAMALLPHP
jgi:hypothetical protein